MRHCRYEYEIVGHSGESHKIPLVGASGKEGMPRTRADRLQVIAEMYNHASFCMSGDHTLAASVAAVEDVTAEPGDDYYVFLVSDANLAMYGVNPKSLAKSLMSDPKVCCESSLLSFFACISSLTVSTSGSRPGELVCHFHRWGGCRRVNQERDARGPCA